MASTVPSARALVPPDMRRPQRLRPARTRVPEGRLQLAFARIQCFRPLPLGGAKEWMKRRPGGESAPSGISWLRHKITFIALNTIRHSARERARLVAVDFAGQPRQLTRTAALARDAALASLQAGVQGDPLEAQEPAPPSAA